MSSSCKNIIAIVVTFNPAIDEFIAIICVLLNQVSSVIVVDNCSRINYSSIFSKPLSGVDFVRLESNLGIGVAQNIGIKLARQASADFILLMDQDSIPSPNMVSLLLDSYESFKREGNRIAAIGPRFLDGDSGRLSSHITYGRFGTARIDLPDELDAVPVDFLISSGSLIQMDVLDVIGVMDESLFIDHVDTEWVLRAQSMGYVVYGHNHATMIHNIGENRLHIWYGRWREVPIHKAFRYYYVYRNSILLMRREYISMRWKRTEFFRLFQMTVFLLVFHPKRIHFIKAAWRGIFDGFRGHTGPLSIPV